MQSPIHQGRPSGSSFQGQWPPARRGMLMQKWNLYLDQGETEDALEVKDKTPGTPRSKQRQALAEAISTAMSK